MDEDLHDYVAAKLTHHRESDVLKYGLCDVEVVDDDTLRIIRSLDGVDAFGKETETMGKEIFTIRR